MKAQGRKTLLQYLNKYRVIQEDIVLCYRPYANSSWTDRCLLVSDDFIPTKRYNHRIILHNEIVIEFDDNNVDENRKNADEVAKRLKRDGFSVAKWTSGNKSTHVHTFIDVAKCKNIQLLKRVFMKYYCKNLPLPDYQLCGNNHLIRAEYGVHEKTQKYKSPIFVDKDYPRVHQLSPDVWYQYGKEERRSISQRMSTVVNSLDESPIVKSLLQPSVFRELADDGRERMLYVFAQVLKHKYKAKENGKQELIKLLQEWYKYSSGTKMTENQVAQKVVYHWNKAYPQKRKIYK